MLNDILNKYLQKTYIHRFGSSWKSVEQINWIQRDENQKEEYINTSIYYRKIDNESLLGRDVLKIDKVLQGGREDVNEYELLRKSYNGDEVLVEEERRMMSHQQFVVHIHEVLSRHFNLTPEEDEFFLSGAHSHRAYEEAL